MFCLLVNHAYKDSHYTQHQPQLFTVANGQILEKCENTSRHVLQGEEYCEYRCISMSKLETTPSATLLGWLTNQRPVTSIH